MKKYILLLAAMLPVLSGCRVNERAFDGTNLYGTLSQFSGTEAASDVPSVAWTNGDSIGVASAEIGNNRFVLTSESAGKTEGSFKGSMTGEPIAAYYPYNPQTTASSIKSVSMTLPTKQTAQAQPDMKLDARVAGKPLGSVKEGFTFEFIHKLALVRFELLPDEDLNGRLLSGLGLSAKGRTFAGNYTMSLENPTADLTFSSGKNSVSLDFTETPQLAQGVKVTGWIFINPDIKEGDALSVSISTDKVLLVADITAEKSYKAGGCYTLKLDIAQLRAAGKIREIGGSEGTVFTEITKYGVFDLSKTEITGIITYVEGEDQYTTYSNNTYSYYSIVNIEKGVACKTSFSKKSLTVGADYSIKTVSAGIELPDATYNTKLVKQTEHMFWFRDDTDNLGFILYR